MSGAKTYLAICTNLSLGDMRTFMIEEMTLRPRKAQDCITLAIRNGRVRIGTSPVIYLIYDYQDTDKPFWMFIGQTGQKPNPLVTVFRNLTH